MKYRLTTLSPLLVGDGQKLSPIDYMVWKDQVNVLDQRRIFRLLARGPRLESYLAQLKRADKLDFASWGGFAQNFADRRVPFEHPSYTAYWERARGDSLHIPTFLAGPHGPYVPGSAIKGALHTALLFARAKESMLREAAQRFQGDRPPRRPAEFSEERALGANGSSILRAISIGDSRPVPASVMKVHLLRVASLLSRGAGNYELAWKQAPRGSVDGRRVEDSTPLFAEMASQGTVFEGSWGEKAFLLNPEIQRALNWKEPVDRARLFEAANQYAVQLLAIHRQYAAWSGLTLLEQNLAGIEQRLAQARDGACLLALGWGSGLLSKTAWPNTNLEVYRQILSQIPLYSRAIQSGLPFPKTRRIVFAANQPATLPGWALLEVG